MLRNIENIEFDSVEEHIQWLKDREGNIREISLYTDEKGKLICRYVEIN